MIYENTTYKAGLHAGSLTQIREPAFILSLKRFRIECSFYNSWILHVSSPRRRTVPGESVTSRLYGSFLPSSNAVPFLEKSVTTYWLSFSQYAIAQCLLLTRRLSRPRISWQVNGSFPTQMVSPAEIRASAPRISPVSTRIPPCF